MEQLAWERSAPRVQRPSDWGSRKGAWSVSVTPVCQARIAVAKTPDEATRRGSGFQSLAKASVTWAWRGQNMAEEAARPAARKGPGVVGEKHPGQPSDPPPPPHPTRQSPPVSSPARAALAASLLLHVCRQDRGSGDAHMHPQHALPFLARRGKAFALGGCHWGGRDPLGTGVLPSQGLPCSWLLCTSSSSLALSVFL